MRRCGEQSFHGGERSQRDRRIAAARLNGCSGELFGGDVSYFDKFYCFDGGSFGASYGIDAPSGNRVDTYIRFTPMNEYVTGAEVGSYITGMEDYQSRSYVTKDGTELVVCQNEQQAMVYGYLDVGYCVLEIHSNDGALEEKDVKYALDFLDFSVIENTASAEASRP